ncbi:MAG: class I SAM-dependent methyltransferase, partial [Planctomycetota bacterium]|nr:class I SAM-dependent methyltransferase [Planctomycetota bacterium]
MELAGKRELREPMKPGLVDILSCLSCGGGEFRVESKETRGNDVIDGKIVCGKCGAEYAVRNGVLRCVESDKYVGNFSFEWQLHRKTQFDGPTSNESYEVFYRKTGIKEDQVRGKKVLDVGVGTGRFADVAERSGAEVVGIDLSYAVEAAVENVGGRDRVNVIQADCFQLPFKKEQFDLIYSIGVLHHTPDCKKAFQGLIPYLKPGGTIVIWVYDAHVWQPGSVLDRVNSLWRSVTTRLPTKVLYGLCLVELPFYFLRKIPFFD